MIHKQNLIFCKYCTYNTVLMFLFSYLLFNVLLKLHLSFHKFQHNVTVLAQGKRDCWSLLVSKADINLVQLYNGQYNNNVVYRTLCDILLKYVYLTCDLRVSVMIRGYKKGSRLGHLGISRPTYCLTSCSSMVRAVVCQPSGPGSILAVSLKSA